MICILYHLRSFSYLLLHKVNTNHLGKLCFYGIFCYILQEIWYCYVINCSIIFRHIFTGACSSYDHPTSLAEKNREADATNPNLVSNNIYHSIEDLNRPDHDHLYDEINQQKGNNIQGSTIILITR